jgi:hypothetical protein
MRNALHEENGTAHDAAYCHLCSNVCSRGAVRRNDTKDTVSAADPKGCWRGSSPRLIPRCLACSDFG